VKGDSISAVTHWLALRSNDHRDHVCPRAAGARGPGWPRAAVLSTWCKHTWVYVLCLPYSLHAQGEPISLLVNHLDSADTILPLDYYSYGGLLSW
jgi:hypothetical protein